MVTRLTTAQRTASFGAPGNVDRIVVTTPWGVRTQVHRKVAGVFLAACNDAHRTSRWRPQRVDGYNHRPVRGSSSPSLHGYALAWDFFATPPNVAPPGGVWTPHNGLPADFAACFTRRGFTWGATWARSDVPHIEWAGYPPATSASFTPQPEEEDDVALTADQTNALAMIPAIAGRVEQLQNELATVGRAAGFSEQYIRETVRIARALAVETGHIRTAAEFSEQYIRETVRIARALADDAGVTPAAAA